MAETLTELIARISADSTELKKALADSEKAVDKSGSSIQSKVESIKKSINGISTAWAGVGAAIIGGMGLVSKSAMDAVESENLFSASLKENAKIARDWSNQMSKALGLNAYELRKNTGTFYVMLQSMGMTNDEALKMSKSMTMLAYDMASFYNLRPEEAFDKIKSGIVGMPRPLQDLGIVINETMIKTYALKTGLIEQGQEMTEQQKITARYGALMEATTTAQGDLARTMDSPVNKMRILGSAIDEVKIIIGENLLPAIGSMLDSFTSIIAKIKEWVSANPQLVKAILAGAFAVSVIITAVFALKAALILLGTTANLMFGGILIAVGALVTEIVWLTSNMDKMIHFWDDVFSNMKIIALTAVDAILAGLENLIGWIPKLGDKIREARNDLANIIRVEKIVKDARDARDALKDVGEALEDTTEIIEENTDATKEQTEAALENIKALKEQKTALEETTHKLKNMRREYEYTRSDAGRLRISLQDVIFTLFDMGKTTEEITSKFVELGEDADDVNKVMEAFGLTAQQVKDILDAQAESVSKLTDSYIMATETVNDFAQTQANLANLKAAITGKTGIAKEEAILAYHAGARSAAEELATQEGITMTQALAVTHGQAAIVGEGQVEKTLPGQEGIPVYQQGGIVANTGLAYLHAGEKVIPANESMGGVTVNFTQPVFFDREDTMNRLVDMIRKGIQRQDRLRFGGAYNG